MSHSSDQEMKRISKIWEKVDVRETGGETLARLLMIYPKAQKEFSNLGNFGSGEDICHNAKVRTHGEEVLLPTGEALKHLDNLEGYYAKLSKDHFEMDPATFVRYIDVLIIVLALKFNEEFTPEVQCGFQKAFGEVSDAYGKPYHNITTTSTESQATT